MRSCRRNVKEHGEVKNETMEVVTVKVNGQGRMKERERRRENEEEPLVRVEWIQRDRRVEGKI